MRPIIVLGSGWLGAAAARSGRLAGLPVETIDRSTRPDLFPPAPPAALSAAVAPAAAIINSCGRLRGDEGELGASNTDLARFVAEAVGPTDARLVHVGSAAEYGPPTTDRIHEDDVVRPVGPYGRTKLEGTLAALEGVAPGRVVVARVFNPVGPGQPDHLPVAEFVRAARSDDAGPLIVRNADTERDFVSIDDVGLSLIRLATVGRLDHDIVNVCSGVGLRYGDLALAILRQTGSARTVRSLGEAGVMRVVGDPTRLIRMTGLKLSASAARMAELALTVG